MDNNQFVWKFGYGSNLSPKNLIQKKLINVIEWAPAKLPNWKLGFFEVGQAFVEPCYANIYPADNVHVHGSVVKISRLEAEKIDKQEFSYSVVKVEVECYDGNKIMAEVYVHKFGVSCEKTPSKRYLDLIISGAKEIGLEPEYIQKLENIVPYTPSPETLQKRQNILELANSNSLATMTIEQIQQFNGTTPDQPVYCSIAGFIFDTKPMFKAYWGRDITYRILLHLRGISIELNDDGGKRPFPVLVKLSEVEREYVYQWLDQYASKGKLVGLLKEFLEDQCTSLL